MKLRKSNRIVDATLVSALGIGAALLPACGLERQYLHLRGEPAKSTLEESVHLTQTSTKPNVLVVMVDDLDVMTFDVAVSNGLLPNIREHFIDRGVSFSRSYVSDSLCCPSRATFLTGQYPSNHGILHVTRPDSRTGVTYWTDIGADSNTLPVWLQSAGYRTGLIGKYLNGYGMGKSKGGTDPEYQPPGYDEWYGLIDPTTYQMYDFQMNVNGKVVDHTGTGDYQLDTLGEKAQTFLAADDARPFFLWITPGAPHNEQKSVYYNKLSTDTNTRVSIFQQSIRPPTRYSYLKDGDAANGEFPSLTVSQSFSEADVSDKHPNVSGSSVVSDLNKTYLGLQFKDRLGAMKAVDDMIGVAIKQLKDSGKYDNTVLVFTSDNGWMYGEHRLSGKQWAYEESIRVPLVISSPLHSGRGSSDRIVMNNDLAPTIVNLTGAVSQRDADGRSLVPLLEDSSASWERKRFFVENYDTQNSSHSPDTFGAIREISSVRDELYINYFSDAEGLSGTTTFTEHYDLAIDPYQLSARNAQHATFVAAVQAFATCAGATCQALENLETLTESPKNLALYFEESASKLHVAWDSGGGSTAGFYLAYASGTEAPDCRSGTNVGNASAKAITGVDDDAPYRVSLCAYDMYDKLSNVVSASSTEAKEYVPASRDELVPVYQFNHYAPNGVNNYTTYRLTTASPGRGWRLMGAAFQLFKSQPTSFAANECNPQPLKLCQQAPTYVYYLQVTGGACNPGDTIAATLGYTCTNAPADYAADMTRPLYLQGRTFAVTNGVYYNHYVASWLASVRGWTYQFGLGYAPNNWR